MAFTNAAEKNTDNGVAEGAQTVWPSQRLYQSKFGSWLEIRV